MKIKSINPYPEEVNWSYDPLSSKESESWVESARLALKKWILIPVEQRMK